MLFSLPLGTKGKMFSLGRNVAECSLNVVECSLNNVPEAARSHHYMRRGASYQAVQEQPSGSTEDTVKDPGIGNFLLLLLVHNSLHKQLQGRKLHQRENQVSCYSIKTWTSATVSQLCRGTSNMVRAKRKFTTITWLLVFTAL